MISYIKSILKLKYEIGTFHDPTPSNVKQNIFEDFDIMYEKFDSEKAKIASNQYKELVGYLFPLGSPYIWEDSNSTHCVYIDDSGLLTFNMGLINTGTIDDELRSCIRMFYDYGLAHDDCEMRVDLKDLTWSKTIKLLQYVSSTQMRAGLLIFHTIPARVKRIIIHEPNMVGISPLIRAALSVASNKIQSRVVFC